MIDSGSFRKIRLVPTLVLILSVILCTASSKPPVSVSTNFPSVDDAHEFIVLSNIVYLMRSCSYRHIPSHVTCHTYKEKNDGTQVMVVSSDELKYISVVYAGSDDIKNWITDFDKELAPFGPSDSPISDDVRVHKGFNHAVFAEGLFDEIYDTVQVVLGEHPDYRLIMSGHSLGAADSILTGAAFAHYMPDYQILVLNYGCPRTGDQAWKEYANGLQNLGVWRFVYRDDIVPRLPGKVYRHVGHTVQFFKHAAKAYYLHNGDRNLGYVGVPLDWESESFVNVMESSLHHITYNYMNYIHRKSQKNPETYFVDSFETKEAEEDVISEETSSMDDDMYEEDFYETSQEEVIESSIW